MFKFVLRSFSTRTKELKDSVVGAAKEVVNDAKKVTAAATQTLQDDFYSIGEAVATASDRIDQIVRGTDKERFHAAEEAGKRAEQEENKFVFNEHAENPLNKAAKMAHEAKENIKDNIKEKIMNDAKDNIKEKISDTKGNLKEKMSNLKENIKEKVSDTKENIKEKMTDTKENLKENMSDTKDEAKSAYNKSIASAIRAQHANTGYSEPRESMGQKVEQMAENVISKVKETVSSVKDTLTSHSPHSNDTPPVVPPMDAANINPMGDTPNREPLAKPQKPLNHETEELQKKGAERKAEEDSFNLM